ncbi:8febf273-d1a5-4da0-98ce-867748ad0fa8 [Sclerotinia trifoliorum]|uniref:8febf273-d1a5-4da0-98ce-867748ad0fa8 n=1 Tax=Sclerotinia trifoliorum TaxID=28548 RepID=A0A8H2VWF1_9HELO|nr:8febf273-d1a5-4da0-98ce-867748ad0fa8 [Sclerotinia trifoliorum]
MRSSIIAALCAAPLALAGNLQHDLVGRGVITPEFTEKSSELVVKEKDITIVQAKSEVIIIIWTNNGGGAATQTLTETKTVTQGAGAATHTVTVGGAAGTVYTPDTVSAAVGDVVVFNFEAKNHSLTQSGFATPCEKLAEGMDTGFVPNVDNAINPPPSMAMQVMTDTPQWFYCRQAGHCGLGMVFSINPTANKSQAMFKAMAVAQNGTGTLSAIQGGTPSSGASAEAASSAVASPASPAAAVATVASGTGTTGADGTCSCSCLCGQAAFPNAAVQGVGMFGGISDM